LLHYNQVIHQETEQTQTKGNISHSVANTDSFSIKFDDNLFFGCFEDAGSAKMVLHFWGDSDIE
jgi:hypothetical protein